jgi:voltage-gated potassium channel Kch
MIDTAREFGFKVYYGDGTRLDILHAAGASHARAVLVRDRDNQRLQLELVGGPYAGRAFFRGNAVPAGEARPAREG